MIGGPSLPVARRTARSASGGGKRRDDGERGRLYVVATPLGNLGDITFRAVETLKDVAAIAMEDTRRTRKLLSHYGITTKAITYHEHNETEAARRIVERILRGDNVALVTDAGTPLVSDPGFRLVASCVEEGIPVVPVPGPSAVVAALSAAGLPPHPFYFAGFPPRKPGARRRRLAALADLPCTLVFFESPHRVVASVRDMAEQLGDRPAVIARELSKIHEEFIRDRLPALSERLETHPVKGEIVIVVAGRGRYDGEPSPPAETDPILPSDLP